MTGRTADGRIETVQVVPDGSPVANYAFDVTPARLVTGLITERGVLQGLARGLEGGVSGARRRRTMMRMHAARSRSAALLLGCAGRRRRRPKPNKPILDSAERHKPGAIKLWERLVNIDSGTGDVEGVNAVGAVAVEELKKLGAAIETDSGHAGGRRQHRRELHRLGQRQGAADRPHGHGVRQGRGGGAAVPHRRRARLWPRRVRRQGRHRRRRCRC